MFNAFDEKQLAFLFELNDKECLRRNESSRVEFKANFSLAGLSDFAQDFAAFANHKGGYLIFGVSNAPRTISGLTSSHFQELDPARLAIELNEIFSPSPAVEKFEHTIKEHEVGLLYISESTDKPVIAKKTHGSIKEGDIYYRYDGCTEKIRYAELRKILDEKSLKERDAWMNLFKNAAKVGVKNGVILDTIEGVIHGGDNKVIMLDDSLIEQLKFIKEGSFQERIGDPTLKLVGELVPATVIKKGIRTVSKDEAIYRSGVVADKVAKAINRRFRNQPEHVWAWRYYEIRPLNNSTNPEKTNKKFCEYKAAFSQYAYTQAWVDFLIAELSDQEKYKRFIRSKGIKS